MPTYDRLTILRCKAANAASLSACYREEAASYARMAQAEAPDGDKWSLLDPGEVTSQDTEHLPEDWLGIAELPLPEKPTEEIVR